MNEMVSVIMPVYNTEKYVEEAICSVLSQSYQDWELLVVDDCSTDSSVSIIKRYMEQDRRIHFFQTDSSSGSPVKPRNIGVDAAKGRYIAFLDSDDIWLPDKLQNQIPLFGEGAVAVVFSNYEKMTEEGQCSGRIICAPHCTDYKKLLKGNVIGNVTGVYDTRKVGKIFFQPVHHEDYILWLSILKKGYVARNTNTVTARYRLRVQSVSSNKWKVLGWQWYIYVHVEHIHYLKAVCLFVCYAYKAFWKALK